MATETITATPAAYSVPPGEAENIENLGVSLMAAGWQTNGQLMAGEVFNPGPGGPPMHTHLANDELYYVVAGRYRFKIEETEREGGPGTFVYIPRGTSHTFACSGEEGRLFTVCLPAIDGFLRAMSSLIDAGEEQERMTDLFREYDSTIDGPGIFA